MDDTVEPTIKPDFSAVMTQRIWTRIGVDETGIGTHVEMVYRPNGKLEVWVPMDMPPTSMNKN